MSGFCQHYRNQVRARLEPEYQEPYNATVVQAGVQRLAAELPPWAREAKADPAITLNLRMHPPGSGV